MTQWWMAVSRAWFCAKSTNGEDLSLSLGWQGESFQNIQDFFSDFCFFTFSFFSFCVAFPLTSLFVWRRNWVWNLLPLLWFPFEADRMWKEAKDSASKEEIFTSQTELYPVKAPIHQNIHQHFVLFSFFGKLFFNFYQHPNWRFPSHPPLYFWLSSSTISSARALRLGPEVCFLFFHPFIDGFYLSDRGLFCKPKQP